MFCILAVGLTWHFQTKIIEGKIFDTSVVRWPVILSAFSNADRIVRGQRSKIKPHRHGSIEMLIPPIDHHQIGVECSHIQKAHAHEASAREILKKMMFNKRKPPLFDTH